MQKSTDSGSVKLAAMRRKLFIIASYLVVTALLLVMVSYGQYRISMDAEMNMPSAWLIQASLALENDQRTIETGVDAVQAYLADLKPGDEPEDTNEDGTPIHAIQFQVRNYTNENDVTQLGLQYTVRVKYAARLPLKMILIDPDDDTVTYESVRDERTKAYLFMDSESEEKVFTFGTDETEKSFVILVGWDNDYVDSTNLKESSWSNVTGSLEKEVDVLQVYTEIVQVDPSKGSGDGGEITEEVLKQKIDEIYKPPVEDAGDDGA